jgi:hypothetical protein
MHGQLWTLKVIKQEILMSTTSDIFLLKNIFLAIMALRMGLWSFTVIYPNLREFRQIIVTNHLWNSPDQIKIWLSNHLFGQVVPISGLS